MHLRRNSIGGGLTLLAAFMLSASAPVFAFPVDLAVWTFETSLPATAGPHAAEGGINAGAGSPASGFHASASVVYSNPAGNGSAESFSSTFWSVGDYWQFSTSSVGYTDIHLAWDQASSNTGPRDFVLRQNYPNPMNPSTQILFEIPVAAHVSLKIYDLLDREIRSLTDAPHHAGAHVLHWEGRDNRGLAAPSGVYYYRLQAGSFSEAKRVVLLR